MTAGFTCCAAQRRSNCGRSGRTCPRRRRSARRRTPAAWFASAVSPACAACRPRAGWRRTRPSARVACSGDASVGHTYGELRSRNTLRLGDHAVADAHARPAAASSFAYAEVWPGPPNDAKALDLGRDLDRVGLGRGFVVRCAARLDRDELHRAAVELVVRGEEVDVLLRGRGLLREALVAAAPLEERLLQVVGLGLVERDRDRVLGHARRGRRRRCRCPTTAPRTARRSRSGSRPCPSSCRTAVPSRRCDGAPVPRRRSAARWFARARHRRSPVRRARST